MALPPLIDEAALPDGKYRVTSARLSYGRLIFRLRTIGPKPSKTFGVKVGLTRINPPMRALLLHPLVGLAITVPDDELPMQATQTRIDSEAELKILTGIRFTWSKGRARHAHYETDPKLERFCELFCRWTNRAAVVVREDIPGATWRYRGTSSDPQKRFQFTLTNIAEHLKGRRWYGLRASRTLFSQIDIDQHDRSESTFLALAADVLNALPGYSFLMRTPRGLRVFIGWTRPQQTAMVNNYLARRLARRQIGPTHADGSPAYELYPCENRASRLPFGKDEPIVTFHGPSQTFAVVTTDWRASLAIADNSERFTVRKYFDRNDRQNGSRTPRKPKVCKNSDPNSSGDKETAYSTNSEEHGDPRPAYSGKDTKKWIQLNAGWLQRRHADWTIQQRLDELHRMGRDQRSSSRTISNPVEFDRVARPIVEYLAKTFVPPHGSGPDRSLSVTIEGITLTVDSLSSRMTEMGFGQESIDFYKEYVNRYPAFTRRMAAPLDMRTWALIIVKVLNAMKSSHGWVPRNFLATLAECRGNHKAAFVAGFIKEKGLFQLSRWRYERDDPSLNHCRFWAWNPTILGLSPADSG